MSIEFDVIRWCKDEKVRYCRTVGGFGERNRV